MNRLTLLTTRDCHLCGAARAALDRVAAETGEPWAEVDVAEDTALAREYGDRLPVLLLDGREHGYWDVDVPRLLRDLRRDAPPTTHRELSEIPGVNGLLGQNSGGRRLAGTFAISVQPGSARCYGGVPRGAREPPSPVHPSTASRGRATLAPPVRPPAPDES